MTRQVSSGDEYLTCQKLDASDGTSLLILPSLNRDQAAASVLRLATPMSLCNTSVFFIRLKKIQGLLTTLPTTHVTLSLRLEASFGQSCAAALLMTGEGLTKGVILGRVSCWDTQPAFRHQLWAPCASFSFYLNYLFYLSDNCFRLPTTSAPKNLIC